VTPPPKTGLRRVVLTFVLSVVALDAVVIGIYYAFGIKARPERIQHIFVGVWMGLTLAVVAPNLTRMRKFRGRYRRDG
jgi:hypothetical protein